MKAKIFLMIIIAAAVGIVLWFFLMARKSPAHGELPSPVVIKTGKPQRMNLELQANWIGKSQARQITPIFALGEGTILTIDANDEAMVDKGAALFTLGGPVLEMKLVTAQEKVISLQNRYDIAKSTMERKQESVKEKITSLDDLAVAQTALEQTKTDLNSAKEQLQLLDDTAHVTAAVSGIFTNRRVNTGQRVEKGDELADLIAPNQVRIVATVFAYEASGLEGQKVTFTAPDGNEITAVVTKVMPVRAAAGGPVVRIESKEIDRQIKPGIDLSGRITAAVHNNVLAVPKSAVIYDQNDVAYVYLRVNDKYQKRQVTVGLSYDDWLEITSGITQSDEVVTEGGYELFYESFSKSYKVPD